MKSTLAYIKAWQKALKVEIQHLKKYGSTKHLVVNGHLLTKDKAFTYYFDTYGAIRVPVGSIVKLEWGSMKKEGRVLSSEGKSVIISFDESFGDLVTEAYIYHDPWELLDQLYERLEEMIDNKKKRSRVKRLMTPDTKAKHPTDIIKSSVHELILRSKYNPVTFVWGPPGTGKTYTLARVAANKYFKQKKVLLLSHSNQSVDVLLKEIAIFVTNQNRYQEGGVLRYGSRTGEMSVDIPAITTAQLLQKREPNLAEEKEKVLEERRLLKQDLSRSFSKRDSDSLLDAEKRIARILDKIRSKEMDFLKEAFVIGTTLAKAASDPAIYKEDYDVVILDEASMAYVPQAAFAASLAKNVIICGDFKQLPPIAAARHESVDMWLREDIFHRTGVADTVKEGEIHPHLFILKEQRRMHPAISGFTNKYIYHSLVGDHISVYKNRQKIASRRPFPNTASILLSTSFTGEHALIEKSSRSRINLWHLLLSFQLIHEAYLDGARSIGFISPYRAQANWMEAILEDIYEEERHSADIIAATVHRFQGSERDVMIFDTVDTYPMNRPGMLLVGKDSERLLNVAITRTRGKFIHISDTAYMKSKISTTKTLRQLLDYQSQHQHEVLPKDIGSWVKNQHPRVQWMHGRKLEKVFHDITQASTSILVGLPKQSALPLDWEIKLNDRKKQVKVTVVTGEEETSSSNQKYAFELTFPFIIIDRRYLWLGIPVEAAKRVRPPHVCVRVDSQSLCDQLVKQFMIES